jgi:hypothetical protein
LSTFRFEFSLNSNRNVDKTPTVIVFFNQLNHTKIKRYTATDISKFSEFKDLLNSFVIQFTKDLGGLIDLLSQRKNMIDAFISPYFDYDMYRYLFPDLVYIVN